MVCGVWLDLNLSIYLPNDCMPSPDMYNDENAGENKPRMVVWYENGVPKTRLPVVQLSPLASLYMRAVPINLKV